MAIHPFFIAAHAQHSIKSHLRKTIGAVEDQVLRTRELTNETGVLINLVSIISGGHLCQLMPKDTRHCNVAGYKGCC